MSLHRMMTAVASLTTALVLACAPSDSASDGAEAGDTTAGAEAAVTSVADVGLATPESVLYDEQADVYIVSNINGEPAGRDGNGFISRIRPDGTVEALKWVDGAADGVNLDAPKGLALIGDTLFVSDIDTVRAFHRTSGAPLGARGVAGASFLNDLAVGNDNTLYVTDTGVDGSFQPAGTDAIYRFTASGPERMTRDGDVTGPNGIVADDTGIVAVSFSSADVSRLNADGSVTPVATLPTGGLDGVVRMDGMLFVSSWEGQAIYSVAPDGQIAMVADSIESPADIGFDTRRHRILVPQFNLNRIEFIAVH